MGDSKNLNFLKQWAILSKKINSQISAKKYTQTEFLMMKFIETEGPVTPAQIGEGLSMKKPLVSRFLSDIEDKGFLHREIDAFDKRTFALTLTDSGKNMLKETEARMAKTAQEMLENLDAAEIDTIIKLLEKMVKE